jgi:hypothetical protein
MIGGLAMLGFNPWLADKTLVIFLAQLIIIVFVGLSAIGHMLFVEARCACDLVPPRHYHEDVL